MMISQAQIRALRATAAALLAQLEALDDEMERQGREQREEREAFCDHPENLRNKRVATFDEPGRWMCGRCGHIGGEKAAAKE